VSVGGAHVPGHGQVGQHGAGHLDKSPAPTERPIALPVLPHRVPVELVFQDAWLVWRWAWDLARGRWTKPPSCARTGLRVGATDPAARCPFAAALAAYRAGGWDGLGFALSPDDPFVGIDLDKCRDPETGVLAPWAQDVVGPFRSYAEASPSGTGVRVWVKGSLAGLLGDGRMGTRRGPVEVYGGGRYLTVTGHALPGAPEVIRERQAALASLIARLIGPAFAESAAATSSSAVSPVFGDEEVLARARSARNGAKLAALFDSGDTGPYGGDDSAADLALCALLAFWTRDPAQIDRLVRRSALYRPKWNRPDYRERTIARALAGGASFDPGARPVRLVRSLPPARGGRPVVDLSVEEESARGR